MSTAADALIAAAEDADLLVVLEDLQWGDHASLLLGNSESRYYLGMPQSGALVTVGTGRQPFRCHVCQGDLFTEREIKLNTTGAEIFNMGWANQSATGLVCNKCSYLHTFLAGVELWKPEGGYPKATD